MRTYVSFGLTRNVLVLEHHPSLDLRSIFRSGYNGVEKSSNVCRAPPPRLLRDESSPDIHATRDGMLLAESSPFRLRGTLVIRSTVARPVEGWTTIIVADYYSWHVFGLGWFRTQLEIASKL